MSDEPWVQTEDEARRRARMIGIVSSARNTAVLYINDDPTPLSVKDVTYEADAPLPKDKVHRSLSYEASIQLDPETWHRLTSLFFCYVLAVEGWRTRLASDLCRQNPDALRRAVRRAWAQNIALRWEYFDRA